MSPPFRFFRLLLLPFLASAALAHDPGLSSAFVDLSPTRTRLTVSIAQPDALKLAPIDTDRNGSIDVTELAKARPVLTQLARSWLQVVEGPVEAFASAPTAAEVTFNGIDLGFIVEIEAGLVGDCVIEFPHLLQFGARHRHWVTVLPPVGEPLAEDFVSPAAGRLAFSYHPAGAENAATAPPEHTQPTADPAATPAHGANFFVLGIEHILTGYDHLLYLGALIIVCRSLRSIIAIITSFTIAHSLTLAVATLGHLDLPSRWVEPLIAASIVFVGAENLWRRGEEPRGRWLLTFAFGLIHGFGFAGLLRELGVGSDGGGVARPLLEFNLGVEVGQIAVALVTVPLLHLARRRQAVPFTRYVEPALSSLILLMGAWWLVDRVVS